MSVPLTVASLDDQSPFHVARPIVQCHVYIHEEHFLKIESCITVRCRPVARKVTCGKDLLDCVEIVLRTHVTGSFKSHSAGCAVEVILVTRPRGTPTIERDTSSEKEVGILLD